ncbi:MAG: M23 family metallopeptidase [Anaerolineae bacterium]|nr:M23 family metallopeptidase [Anaerolineae bacterium]
MEQTEPETQTTPRNTTWVVAIVRGYGPLLAALALVAISAVLILRLPTRALVTAPTATPTATPTLTPTPTPRPPLPTPGAALLDDLARLPVAGADGAPLARDLEPFTLPADLSKREEVLVYTVQRGDTLWSIAERFNLKMDSLFWANREALPDVHMLRVGLQLNILPEDGVYHTADGAETIQEIAERFNVTPETIIDSVYNDLAYLAPEDAPPPGTRIVVPGGADDYADWVWRPEVIYANTASGGVGVNFAPGHPGSCGPVPEGTGSGGVFANPVSGWYQVGWQFQEWHRGIDLMTTEGIPVVAAAPGTVIFAGWNTWGYGNLIVLSHGDGWTTYYAHLSYLNVGCGQYVSTGQFIGEIGTTGRSSGPHLHFEIRQNGEPLDPANFVGF